MTPIHVEVVVRGSLEKVWSVWNEPEHITTWAFASDDWECPHAENDLRVGGRFLTRMAAKDGSFSFDIPGTYTAVEPYTHIAYTMDNPTPDVAARTVSVTFTDLGDGTVKVAEDFDPEHENSAEMQQAGWQSILENFKKAVEAA
jgi:uncharacterized protein YndB with AHSA1/START domain